MTAGIIQLWGWSKERSEEAIFNQIDKDLEHHNQKI